ncbi:MULTISPECIES: antibiotic biosynthesis monooxygenase [unclassified Streptomyces]|uniref:antibiotic biosynthesis monooxygenase family protein n=1 Tax=unclassified Streptomyces TaxID=2593676 RepID=UPI00225A4F02|nr:MULTISPECIES: antibiotic biosynthesis monooxygenase [unclassified Streptomyces]MCX4409874.1 antibiotic biosynthesis monooxygenase [Streptomyces sp. NBC_01764]MCX5191647.1 antibiotic biosynthesis monooxygenase [Streptomyces sp. NBC_00268]
MSFHDGAVTDSGITLIDAWELPEERIDESIARWRERVGLIHAAPGFRDARLHRRLFPESRLGLVNVAHWDSIEARDDALANPGFTASAATAASYATVHGGWYEVPSEFRAVGNGSGEGPGITFINAFELPAKRIDEFLPHWLGRAELLSKAPGFRDNRLHRAVDPDTRFQLVSIAHWDSPDAWRTADNDPRFQQRLSASPDFAIADPALFRVVVEF